MEFSQLPHCAILAVDDDMSSIAKKEAAIWNDRGLGDQEINRNYFSRTILRVLVNCSAVMR